MKILMVGPFPRDVGAPVGGVESAVANLVEGLTKVGGVELDIISVSPDITEPESRELPIGTAQYFPIRGGVHGWLKDLHGTVMAEVRRRDADVRHVQAFASVAARLPNSILTVHGYAERDAYYSHSGVSRYAHFAAAAVLEGMPRRGARNVIAISELVAAQHRWTSGRLWQIPNAINPAFTTSPSDLGRAHESSVLFAGRITPLKNISGIIRGFARAAEDHNDAQLVIAGPGVDTEYGRHCVELTRRLNLAGRVDFIGTQSVRQLASVLAEAGSLVLFSWQENAPMIVAEALALGKPVVGSAVGAVPQMLRGVPGCHLVRPGDVGGLSTALVKVLGEDVLQTSSLRAEYANRFSAVAVATKTMEAYRTMASC